MAVAAGAIAATAATLVYLGGGIGPAGIPIDRYWPLGIAPVFA